MIPERSSLELFELLALWCDGTIDQAGQRRLEERLASDAAARQHYIEYLDMHARLYWDRRSPALAASLLTAFETHEVDMASICRSRADAVQARRARERNSPIPSLIRRESLIRIGAGIAAVALLALAIAWGMHRDWTLLATSEGGVSKPGAGIGRRSPPESAVMSAPLAESTAPAVAELSRLVDAHWSDSHCSFTPGEKLRAGQILRLASGVAEIRFSVGVRMVVQAPAMLEIESAKSARLERGKLSAEITTVAARGFQIKTPESTFVDQGTEFGVEVSPDGNSRVHVFKGEVDVQQAAASGQVPGSEAPVPQRLLATSEAWLEKDSKSMTLLEDTGDSFIRTVEQYEKPASGRDRHVVAYWRFEDRPLGVVIPNTRNNRRSVRATLDSSYNGNDLFAYSDQTHPSMSDDVPAAVIPGSKEPNRGCLDNSEPPAHISRDLYTHSAFSHASPQDIQAITPEQWTIEASIKPARLQSGAQTFIGRDGNEPGAAVVVPARLVFQIDCKDRFKIGYVDVQQRWHEAIAEQVAVEVGHWYHVAATSDGKTLKLFVDVLDGRGYQLAAATGLPRDGSSALSRGTDGAEWSLGRGKIKNHVAENFRGWIDEVRFSDVARDPSEFVFAQDAGFQEHRAPVR